MATPGGGREPVSDSETIEWEQHVLHYPLNGIDLHIAHYHHRTLGVSDVLAHRLVRCFLQGTDPVFARKVPFAGLHFDHPPARNIWHRLHPLWQDVQVLNKLLALHPGDELDVQNDVRPIAERTTVTCWSHRQCRHERRGPSRLVSEFVMDVLQRHYLETSHPEMEDWLSYWPVGFSEKGSPAWPHRPGRYEWSLLRHSGHRLCTEEREHTRKFHCARRVQHEYDLFSQSWLQQISRIGLSRHPSVKLGPARRPPPRTDVFAMTDRNRSGWPLHPLPVDRFPSSHARRTARMGFVAAFPLTSSTRRTRRSSSEPPPGSWTQGYLRRSCNEDCTHEFPAQGIYFYKASLSEILRRYRRRSLSRRNIKDMFHVPSWVGGSLPDENLHGRWNLPKPKMERHFAIGPETSDSDSECPLCNRHDHTKKNCKVSKPSHCKCGGKPKHLARNCQVQCSRQCRNPHPPGHPNKHPNAILCKSRCCMCGIRGRHNGKECRYKKCRCGGEHLGQDCLWNPTCKVKGCDRFHCGVHCRECGSSEKPFVIWRCEKCLENGRPVGSRADGEDEEGLNAKGRRNRRRWERKSERAKAKMEQASGAKEESEHSRSGVFGPITRNTTGA